MELSRDGLPPRRERLALGPGVGEGRRPWGLSWASPVAGLPGGRAGNIMCPAPPASFTALGCARAGEGGQMRRAV